MNENRHFYHCFPRPRPGEAYSKTVDRGWAILQSISRSGLVLAPEVVEWKTPVSIGSPSPVQILQQRICFTELSRNELGEHAKRFGPFAIESDPLALRRAGALPVIYMPQALSEQDHLALLGPIIVSHLGHIRHTMEQLNTLDQFKDPEFIQNNFPGARRMADDCVLTLRNGDASRGTVQEFRIPWSAAKDLLSFVGFENAPFGAMIGVAAVAQSLFYPTDDDHVDDRLGYYRQREWRITADYVVNGAPRGRPLAEEEKNRLKKLDKSFWNRELTYQDETFRRIDKAVVLLRPSPAELSAMTTRLIVPRERIRDTRQLFGDVAIEAW